MSELTLEGTRKITNPYTIAKSWSVEEVFEWAKQYGEVTAQRLLKNEVDGDALLQMDYRDFYHMEIPAGPRRKILSQLAALQGKPSTSRVCVNEWR